MHQLYLEQCQHVVPVKKSTHAKILNAEFHIGFHEPRKDQCDECDTFEKMSDCDKLKNKEKHKGHIRRKEESTQHK